MIIPIRCFTCGNPLSDKWQAFVDIVNTEKSNKNIQNNSNNNNLNIEYLNYNNPTKSLEGETLDNLELHRYCCRRMILTNIQLTSVI